MSHLVLLGLEVETVDLIRFDDDRNGFHNLDAVTEQSGALGGVVGDEAQTGGVLVAQDLRSDTIVALIGLEAELDVGLHGVAPQLLQMVRPQFVHQSDATTLLVHVEHHSPTLFIHHLHRAVKLSAAVALARAEDVAGDARRMHPHEHIITLVPLALAEYQVGESVVELGVGNQFEVAPLRRQIYLLLLTDEGFCFNTIGDKILNGNNFDTVAFSDFHQLGHASHGTIGVNDFDEC